MRLELNVVKEWEFNNALEFIKYFKLERLARKIWKIPKETPIEEWEWFDSEYGLTDEEVISKLLEYMDGYYVLDYIGYNDEEGYFLLRQLSPTNPFKLVSKEINPSSRDLS